jgi:hypothetical protein
MRRNEVFDLADDLTIDRHTVGQVYVDVHRKLSFICCFWTSAPSTAKRSENRRLFRFGHFTILMKQDFQDAHPC